MLVKTLNFDNATINIYDDFIPKNQQKYNDRIIEIYDSINKIKFNCEKKGIDISDWFYKKNELKKNRGK